MGLSFSEPLPETPDRSGGFPRLNEEQIEALEAIGERQKTEPGDVLFRAGEETSDFIVVLEGSVAIVEGSETEDRVLGVHGPGRFLGELNLMIGQASFVTGVVNEGGEVLVVPVERMREVAVQDPALADLILRAYLIRRSILIGLGTGMRIIGSRHSVDTRRLRDFATRNRMPFTWVELEEDDAAEALLRELGIAPEETPVVILGGERVLRNPSNAELAEAIGMSARPLPDTICDLLVVGAGPAGLAAAVYGASEGLATVVFEAIAIGGQAGTTSRIENYLGFPAGISGGELADRARVQAEKFGAHIRVPAEVTSLENGDGPHRITLDNGSDAIGRTVLIATGAHYRKLDVPRLEEFEGSSVHYAATDVEGRLCAGDPVVVAGGGNSAGQATEFLTRQHNARVTQVVREGELGLFMSRYLAERIESNPAVTVMLHAEVRELIGEGALEAVVVEDTQSGDRTRVEARQMFVFIGAEPHTDWLSGHLALDERGYILTGAAALREAAGGAEQETSWPLLLETNRPGVLAAGDVRCGSIKRVASAVGEGAMAVRFVHECLRRDGA